MEAGSVDQFWKAIHQSLRSLLKRPAFLAVTVLTLALGIGANSAIFSVVNGILLRQLPFRHEERIVWITEVRPGRTDAPFSLPDFLDYRDHVSSLDSLSAVGNWSANLTGQGDAERLNGVRVSANLFATLGVNAAIGRALQPDDDRPGSPRVVVMTNALWQRRFGSDISLIGKPLDLNGVTWLPKPALPRVISAFKIYVDGVDTLTSHTSTLDTTISLIPGTHRLSVKAWATNGEIMLERVYVTAQ
jgi:putative ABC transport system permease protein